MKKYAKKLAALLFACMTLISAAAPAHAAPTEENPILPAYAVNINTSCNGTVSADSTLHVTCTYGVPADSGVTRVDITAYVEKRTLLVRWDRVDINQPNNEWTRICYGINNSSHFSAPLPSAGTYRVTCIFEVYKGTTLVETIEETTNNFTC